MTRQEFWEEINDFAALASFCGEVDHDFSWMLRDSDEYDDYVQDRVNDYCGSWSSLRDWLNDIPDPQDYDWFDVEEMEGLTDDNFMTYKRIVDQWVDGSWDEEDPEDDGHVAGDEYFECAPTPPKNPEDPDFLMLLCAS